MQVKPTDDGAEYQLMLNLRARLTWLKELTLVLDFWNTFEFQNLELDLTPLLQLCQLEFLETMNSRLGSVQYDIIKQLPLRPFERACTWPSADSVIKLSCYPWKVKELESLFSPPHRLQQ
jgi:hypothetical protein